MDISMVKIQLKINSIFAIIIALSLVSSVSRGPAASRTAWAKGQSPIDRPSGPALTCSCSALAGAVAMVMAAMRERRARNARRVSIQSAPRDTAIGVCFAEQLCIWEPFFITYSHIVAQRSGVLGEFNSESLHDFRNLAF
jgi:predicted transcriptional regulator